MLRFHHFFEGMLKKEEAASAFLAMALEGVPSFRHHFFAAAGIPDEWLGRLQADTWEPARVERDRVDVRLASSTHVVLIENKIQSGAKQKGQLLRYYRRERKQSDRIVLAVYLAPGGMGIDEVEAVEEVAAEARKSLVHLNDRALHVPWARIIAYLPHTPDHDEALVQDGLRAIGEAIERAKQEVYGGEERAKLRDLFGEIDRQASARVKSVPLRLWHASNEDIETNHTTVSVHVKTRLDSVSRTSPTVGRGVQGRLHKVADGRRFQEVRSREEELPRGSVVADTGE